MKTTSAQEWLLRAVRYFRGMEFFTEYRGLSDEELSSYLEKRQKEKWRQTFDPGDRVADLVLLVYDENRVWWHDTEADVMEGNDIYVDTLREWSKISRGKFLCENVQEIWKGKEGPIEVTFDYKGRHATLQPEYLWDYIDTRIILPINQLISDTGMEFAKYAVFDQTAFIVTLTPKEKAKLQVERGWRFADS